VPRKPSQQEQLSDVETEREDEADTTAKLTIEHIGRVQLASD